MIRIMVQLTEEQKTTLEKLAKSRKVSVARLVRESVAEYIVKVPVEPGADEKRKRALAVIGLIKKSDDPTGAADVSVNHDKYLDEIYGS